MSMWRGNKAELGPGLPPILFLCCKKLKSRFRKLGAGPTDLFGWCGKRSPSAYPTGTCTRPNEEKSWDGKRKLVPLSTRKVPVP